MNVEKISSEFKNYAGSPNTSWILAATFVPTVIGHSINEEQRQDFNALALEFAFLFKMLFDGLPDLRLQQPRLH